jgi:BirA family transcriptional regulator, biotin operon repressor / biotin---[acetyl-CoA-carboxylase] ligase
MSEYRPIDILNPFNGAPVLYSSETGSTMTDAREAAARGLPSGSVFVAASQTAGRGRFPGRVWQAAPGESLLCTLLLGSADIDQPASSLPLLAGLGVAMALEREYGLTPRLKWPNDVLLQGRKLCGVLCQADGQLLLAGIGINCLQTAFPPELASGAVSLRQALGRAVAPLQLLPVLLRELQRLLAGEPGWRGLVVDRLQGVGEQVEFRTGLTSRTGLVRGCLLGIDPDGQILLRLEGSGEVEAFPAGELVFH